MSRKIVITGITSFRNHGVEALVQSTVEQLRDRLGDGTSFLILDRAPDYDSGRLQAPDVTFRQDATVGPLVRGRIRRVLNRLSETVPSLDREYQEVKQGIAGASCAVASGGDVFCSEYGHLSLLSHLAPLRLAQDASVPVVLHAQSIGPFTNDQDRQAFVSVATEAAAVTVRESASHRYLLDDLGLPVEKVRLVADPAFLLKQPEPDIGEALWRHHLPDNGRPNVALSTSAAICHWMKEDKSRHVETWLEVIRWLRTELDANIVLIPHVQELSKSNDDRTLATDIQRALDFDPAVRIAGGDFGAGDFKAIISRCDFLVAERMHAAIAGLSTGVPTLVVGYSIKAEGILTDLVGEELTAERALVSIQDYLAPGNGLAKVKSSWEGREALASALDRSLPAMKKRSAEAYDAILAALP